MQTSRRAQRIEPFYVMEVAKAASALALEVAGEADCTAPPLVQKATARAMRDGRTRYTQATGLGPLRERISDWYRQRFNVMVPARRIVVTAGASAALQLACLALIDRGDKVLLPTTAANRYQLTADQLEAVWTPATRGVVRPDGAFYAWADCSDLCRRMGLADGRDFAFAVMHRAPVAITPGRDFGNAEAHRFVRFSTASAMPQVQQAVGRLQRLFASV